MMTTFVPSHRSRRLRALATAFALMVLALLAGQRAALANSELPGDSIYQLDVALVDQDARASRLAEHRGKPLLISMFYSSCKFVCPLIIDTLKKTERSLEPADLANLDVLLVSFDPEKDTPEQLKNIASRHKVAAPRWTLARTDADQVRKLAAVLDIQYRALDDGEFNHTSVLILLDPQGRIVARSDKLGAADPELVAALKRTVAPPSGK